jgi:hypothetical protein
MNIPVCLDPSPRVALVNNIVNYNRYKFARWDKCLRLKPPKEAAVPRIYFDTLNQMAHQMDKRNKPTTYRPASLEDLRSLSTRSVAIPSASSEFVPVPVGMALQPPVLPSGPFPYDPATTIVAQRESLHFSHRNGTQFTHFELEECTGMGYKASLRMGLMPYTDTNGSVIRFLLRDAAAVSQFISKLNAMIKREGGNLIKESDLRRSGGVLRSASVSIQKVGLSPGPVSVNKLS